jgi:CcmD family protein
MKNLESVFAAYLIAWAVFFVYYLTVARRTVSLREEIERLKNSLSNSPNRGK